MKLWFARLKLGQTSETSGRLEVWEWELLVAQASFGEAVDKFEEPKTEADSWCKQSIEGFFLCSLV